MRIAIEGPPGSGKKTLAGILEGLVTPEHQLLDRIEADSLGLETLEERLSSHKHWIFADENAGFFTDALNIPADCLIRLKRHHKAIQVPDSKKDTHQNGSIRENSLEKKVILGGRIPEVLPKFIESFWGIDILRRPLKTLVLKVASRCNLKCDYCYMFEMADQTWKDRPAFMSPQIAERTGYRLAEYLKTSGQEMVNVIFHGGEPLLLGVAGIQTLASSILAGAGEERNRISFGIQTNGTLITDEILATLDEFGFSLGISLDDLSEEGNAHRKFHSGRSSLDSAMVGIKRAQAYPWKRGRFSGVLCVIDPDQDGEETFQAFTEAGIQAVDFLLQDGNWDNKPPRDSHSFLIDAFNAWVHSPFGVTVRFFETAINHLLGCTRGVESLGLRPNATFGVNTDGQFELLDALRATEPGAWELPYSIAETPIEEILSSKENRKIWMDKFSLHDACLECRYLFTCGGGYLPHRYSSKNRYLNPSVHCDDLRRFFQHVENTLTECCSPTLSQNAV